MIKAIIFDVYGTLIDTKDGSVIATKSILNKNNNNLDPKEVYSKWKKYHAEHIRELSDFLKEEDIFLMDLKKLYIDFKINGDAEEDIKIMLRSLYEREAYPETKDVLDKLKSKYKIYIGSNTDTEPLLINLKRNEIEVDKYFTSESLQVYKPKKDFFTKILNQINCTIDEVAYVGDSQIDDILGAKALNILTIWVNLKNQKLQENIPKPNFEISNLKELLNLL